MKIRQSKYILVVECLCCVLLSFLVCLFSFNIFSVSISTITAAEWICSFLASLGVDIIAGILLYERFLREVVETDGKVISFCGKKMNVADILDVNIDSTLNKSVKKSLYKHRFRAVCNVSVGRRVYKIV